MTHETAAERPPADHCCLALDWFEIQTCARFGITCGPETCARKLVRTGGE